MTACRATFLRLALAFALCLEAFGRLSTVSAANSFELGTQAYRSGDYTNAATNFLAAAASRPSSGALQNLGLAEWRRGYHGAAIVAWEQARWLDPFNSEALNNLRFARRNDQLEAPELAWYEVVSTWLPVNWWSWIAGASFWFALGIATVPGILRLRKTAWQQACAAFSLAVFLLSLPAHFGVNSRAGLAFILQKNTPLRLTPTEEAQYVSRLQSGEPARIERTHGRFVLLRTNRALGWVERDQVGAICPR